MKELTGRHVLFILLGFFGVVLAVNSFMVYRAVTTFSGHLPNAYKEGLRYNDRLAEAKAQTDLQWSHKVEMSGSGILQVTFADRSGAPLAGLHLKGDIGRPSSNRFTHELTFTEKAPGVYTASSGAEESGGWIVTVAASRSAAQSEPPVYRIKERLVWLRPQQQ